MNAKRKRLVLPVTLVVILAAFLCCAAAPIWYTYAALNWARSQGIYRTPQEGVIDRAYRGYCGVEKVEIEQATTNSFDGSNPHIWYVIFKVSAKNRAPCDPQHPGQPLLNQTYEGGGNFYLNVKDGWVMMPEGFFPEFIGNWMKVLNLAGPGDPTHIHRTYY